MWGGLLSGLTAVPNKTIPQGPTDASHLCAESGRQCQTGHCPLGAPVGAGGRGGRGAHRGLGHTAQNQLSVGGTWTWVLAPEWGLGWGQLLRKQRSPQSLGWRQDCLSELQQTLGGLDRGGLTQWAWVPTRVRGWGARVSRAQECGFPRPGALGPGQGAGFQRDRACGSSCGLVGPCLTSWRKLGWGLPITHGEGRCVQARGGHAHTHPAALSVSTCSGRRALLSRWCRLCPIVTVVLLLTCKYLYEVTPRDASRLLASLPRGLGWEAQGSHRGTRWPSNSGSTRQAEPLGRPPVSQSPSPPTLTHPRLAQGSGLAGRPRQGQGGGET